jgi:alkanesulfonate monooxygenase SsuD/methylene tetrahydromethanopterin reductase-like flavin-dependent oxidoreductase (luciferase family)
MTVDQVHLAVGLNGAGWHPAAWSEDSPDVSTAQFWIDAVSEAERGRLDLVTIDDVVTDAPAPRLDAVLIASRVAAHTAHIGLVPSVDVANADPFRLAQAIATLDAVSNGRAGVHLRHAPADIAAYAGRLRSVWDALAPAGGGEPRLVDTASLHYVAFTGERFSVLGPTVTPVPPTSRPAVLLPSGSPDSAVRTDDHALALRDVVVVLDITASAARARVQRLDDVARAPFEPEAELFVGTPGQLADFILDGPDSGYRLLPASTSIDLRLVTRRLVPELQLRGAVRTEYRETTLAELLGLSALPGQPGADRLRAAG